MDYLLIFLGIVMMIAGLLGCMLPVLPGPPLSYIGMLRLHFSEKYQFSSNFLIGWAVVTIIVYLLDYLIPIWGTKRFGGSKRGIWGSIIGLMIGMFVFPPIGIIVGPFAGAVIGELSDGKQSKEAFRSGLGTFIGFLIGTLLKLIASGMMAWYFIAEMI